MVDVGFSLNRYGRILAVSQGPVLAIKRLSGELEFRVHGIVDSTVSSVGVEISRDGTEPWVNELLYEFSLNPTQMLVVRGVDAADGEISVAERP